MSIKGTLTVQNAGPLLERFKRLASDEMSKVFGDALRAAARPVRSAKRSMAPVGSGQLAGSIKIGRVTKSRSTSGLGSHRIDVSAGKGSTFYLGFVAFGTGPRFHKSGKSVGRVKPNDFAQQAFESSKAEASQIMEQEISAGIDKLAKA